MVARIGTSLVLAILAVFMVGILPAAADHGPLTLYDDFSSPRLTPGKWSTQPRGALEILRSGIGRAELRVRAAGPGKGFPNDARDEIRFPFFLAPDIWAIQAVVRVVDARVASSDPSADQVRAELIGGFYSDGRGAPGAPGVQVDQTGDVFGTVAIRKRGPTGALEVIGFASQCNDARCTTVTICPGSTFGFGTVGRGVPVNLLVEWDGQRMIFKRGTAPGSVYVPPTTGTPTTTACLNAGVKSNTVFKALRTRAFVPTPGAVGDIRATFANVRIFQQAGTPYPYAIYTYYGASLFGPVRPIYASLSLALVAGLVVSQLTGRRRPRIRHGRTMLAVIAFTAVLLGLAVPSFATHLPLSDYDRFTGAKLDRGKWDNATLEIDRRVLGGQLFGSIRVPARRHLGNELAFPYENADQIQTIRAKVRALRFSGGRPEANPTFPALSDGPRAGLRGLFYSDGRRNLADPTDETGDILAQLEIRNNPTGGLAVVAVVLVCDAPGCGPTFGVPGPGFRICFTSAPPGNQGSLGRIFPGQSANLTLDWDGSKFTFRRAGIGTVTFTPPTTGDALSTPCFRPVPTPTPNVKAKGLASRGFMASVSTPYAAETTMAALFDDVFVYFSPYAPSYGYFGASLMGPVRPAFAWGSLALVAGLVVSQFVGWRRRRR